MSAKLPLTEASQSTRPEATSRPSDVHLTYPPGGSMKSQGKGTEVSSCHRWEGRVENSKMVSPMTTLRLIRLSPLQRGFSNGHFLPYPHCFFWQIVRPKLPVKVSLTDLLLESYF